MLFANAVRSAYFRDETPMRQSSATKSLKPNAVTPSGKHAATKMSRKGTEPRATRSLALQPLNRRRTPEQAKEEIVRVARTFLSTHAFHELTVAKLMAPTQISRSAFYAYFDDVYDLAEIFIHELADRISSDASAWFDAPGRPGERIRKALQNAVDFWQVNGRMIRALEDASAQDPRLRKIWRDSIALRPMRLVADAIRRDQAAGLIGPLDAEQMSLALNRFNMTYLNDSFGSRQARDRSIVLATLERVWIAALYGTIPPQVIETGRTLKSING